jgi:hypothetical protein
MHTFENPRGEAGRVGILFEKISRGREVHYFVFNNFNCIMINLFQKFGGILCIAPLNPFPPLPHHHHQCESMIKRLLWQFASGHSHEFLGRSVSVSHILGGRLGRHPSLAEVLRTTTLEELFEAVEKIHADDEQLIADTSRSSAGNIKSPSKYEAFWELYPTRIFEHEEQGMPLIIFYNERFF